MSFSTDRTAGILDTAARLTAIFAADAAARDRAGGKPERQLALVKEHGLLTIQIPEAFGGGGEPMSTALRIVREFAKTDGSMAHLYGYHTNILNGAYMYGSPAQKERLYRATVRGNLFWSNSGNSFSHQLFGEEDGDWCIVNGFSPFSSGSHVADLIQVNWEYRDSDRRSQAAVPADRPGIRVMHDWDGMGQRQTGSGSVRFENLRIHKDEIYDVAHNRGRPISTLTPLLQQSVLLNVFIGSAQGALAEARLYSTTKSRPWVDSGVEKHSDDPWVQRSYGELYAKTEAATLLADAALDALDQAWSQGEALTAEGRGAAAVKIAAANLFGGHTALEVTSTIFELMGARSATTSNGFDRFWRNVRIHTLHNPAEYKARTVGSWFLTGLPPEPGGFR